MFRQAVDQRYARIGSERTRLWQGTGAENQRREGRVVRAQIDEERTVGSRGRGMLGTHRQASKCIGTIKTQDGKSIDLVGDISGAGAKAIGGSLITMKLAIRWPLHRECATENRRLHRRRG